MNLFRIFDQLNTIQIKCFILTLFEHIKINNKLIITENFRYYANEEMLSFRNCQDQSEVVFYKDTEKIKIIIQNPVGETTLYFHDMNSFIKRIKLPKGYTWDVVLQKALFKCV